MPKVSLSVGKQWEPPPPAPAQALGSPGCPSWGECQAWAGVPLLVPHLGEPQHLHRAVQSLLQGQLMEEPISPEYTDTHGSERGKQSTAGGWSWRLLVLFGCVSCFAFRQGACTGEKWFCSHMWIHSATFPLLSPTPCTSVSSHSQWLPSD